MARVTDAKVRAIRPSDSITDYTPYIETATVIVDQINAKCGKSFDANRLALIETWLAAHYVNVQDPEVSRERFEQAEKTYQIGNRQMYGVLTDQYGQTANMLAEGCLVDFEKRKRNMVSLGHTYAD